MSDHRRNTFFLLTWKDFLILLFFLQELTILEDQEGSVNCKFGVIYAKADQTTDAQMLSNGEQATNYKINCYKSCYKSVKNHISTLKHTVIL